MPQNQMKTRMRDVPTEVVGKSFVFQPSTHCRNLSIRSRRDSSQPPFEIQSADVVDMVEELEDMARRIRQAYDIREMPKDSDNQNQRAG